MKLTPPIPPKWIGYLIVMLLLSKDVICCCRPILGYISYSYYFLSWTNPLSTLARSHYPFLSTLIRSNFPDTITTDGVNIINPFVCCFDDLYQFTTTILSVLLFSAAFPIYFLWFPTPSPTDDTLYSKCVVITYWYGWLDELIVDCWFIHDLVCAGLLWFSLCFAWLLKLWNFTQSVQPNKIYKSFSVGYKAWDKNNEQRLYSTEQLR